MDRDLIHRSCSNQKSECSEHVYSCSTGDDASEYFYSAVDALGKDELIQDIDISGGVARDCDHNGVTVSNSTWPQQNTIKQQAVSYSRHRSQGRSRRHYSRIGNEISVQRQQSLRRPLPQLEHQREQQPYQTQTAYQSQPRALTDATRQRRQLSVRYMRYLSTKPLPLLFRSTSTSYRSRKRSIGSTTAASTRYYGSLQLNKPLPPIPALIVGGSPQSASKDSVDGFFAELDSYHEARSSMVSSDASVWTRGSKQELVSLLSLQGGGVSKEAIDTTTITQGEGGEEGKQDVDVDVCCADGHPWSIDRSESKEELIRSGDDSLDVAIPASTMPAPMSKDELVLSTHQQAAAKGDGTPSTTTATMASPLLTSATNNLSPTSFAALSVKRLESFRFPLRKSPIEKSTSRSMTRHPSRLLHHHLHSHHHSMPNNTTTAIYAHHLSRAALDICSHNELLVASGLFSGFNSALASTITGVARAASNDQSIEPKSTTPQDANDIPSSSPTIGLQGAATGGKHSYLEGAATSGRRHDSGWVSDRYCRQIGYHHQKRVHLRRSESCSNISYHRPSLSFNSSKKALLSLQARRVNKPDAKVLRLPEIQTSAITSNNTTTPTAETLGAVIQGDNVQLGDGAVVTVGEGAGALSGLETPTATAVLLGNVRTASVMSTTPLLPFTAQELLLADTVAVVPAPATIGSPQDDMDYQLRVSESDRVVVDSILTELTTSVTPRKAIIVKGDINGSSGNTVDGETRLSSTNGVNLLVHGNSDVRAKEQETESSTITTTASVEVPTTSELNHKAAPEPSLELSLSAALENAFKIIESGPVVIDAGEIKRFVKRSHALQELESTEQSYVDDLDVLVHVHLRILETKSWFPHNLHTNMRRCVMGLLALHRNFLSQIQVYKMTSESDHEKRAPLKVYRNLEVAFLGLSRDHKLYRQFCELRMRTVNEINRTVGQSTLSVLQKESKELMVQQGRPKSRTDLKDHLIKPIQRICRYPLLLKEILRLTSLGDPEYEFINRAHECMKTLAQQMDETQRIVERKLLTEQFLKKLPETSFPRKSGATLAPSHSTTNSNSDNHNHHRQGSSGAIHPLTSRPGGSSSELELFEGGPFGEGILPGNLTKTYAGTLGSIVLAGALEYVIMPDMPIRLRYYGCFLFESMLIVVKAKKMSLYEPRQWLPLRLCELYETTRLDGYTRYGWRIMYDQFRIDFGASCEAERQAWMSALQNHIQAAKLAHARLPRDTATLGTVVSSLPWNMARPPPPPPPPPMSTLFSGSTGSLLMIGSESETGSGPGPSRQVQVYHQPPSPTPSLWSTCSSAIPSPLMPPPPMATCSTSSTMMMAMSFMTNTGEPEKWNDRGTTGISLDAYAQYYEQHVHPHAHEAIPAHAEVNDSSRLNLTRHLSVESCCDDVTRGYGMAGNRVGNSSASVPTTGGSGQQQDHCYSPLYRSHSQPRTRPVNEPNPLSARKSESAASGSGGGHLLLPSTPFPWLAPDPRPRSHSFDVTRVFSSNHSSGIKPNQRNLVQSMFKDVSTENIWTTTTSTNTNHNNHHHLDSQPSPQPIPNASSSSPMSSRVGRYSSPLPSSYFNNSTSTSTSNSGGSVTLLPPTSPKAIAGMASGSNHGLTGSSALGNAVGEDDETPISTPTLLSAGSSCSSLTSRLLRRRDSGTSAKGSPSGTPVPPPPSSSEKNKWDRRRSSATAAIVAATSALNFRKNSEPSPNTGNSNARNQHHRRRLSIPDPVALLFSNNGSDLIGVNAGSVREGGIYQRISVKARAQLIEMKAAHGLTASFASAPSLAPPGRSKSKKSSSGFGGGKLKSSLSNQDLASTYAASSSSTASLASMSMAASESLATGSVVGEAESDCELLSSLSNAAAEAARSRRGGVGGGGSSERIQRRSIGVALVI
ncbi:hypothetical protein EC991_005070 [Linnemannia zychae]|nr:hypothetical protein EC991_005070 [Linnemannia zychae]